MMFIRERQQKRPQQGKPIDTMTMLLVVLATAVLCCCSSFQSSSSSSFFVFVEGGIIKGFNRDKMPVNVEDVLHTFDRAQLFHKQREQRHLQNQEQEEFGEEDGEEFEVEVFDNDEDVTEEENLTEEEEFEFDVAIENQVDNNDIEDEVEGNGNDIPVVSEILASGATVSSSVNNNEQQRDNLDEFKEIQASGATMDANNNSNNNSNNNANNNANKNNNNKNNNNNNKNNNNNNVNNLSLIHI